MFCHIHSNGAFNSPERWAELSVQYSRRSDEEDAYLAELVGALSTVKSSIRGRTYLRKRERGKRQRIQHEQLRSISDVGKPPESMLVLAEHRNALAVYEEACSGRIVSDAAHACSQNREKLSGEQRRLVLLEKRHRELAKSATTEIADEWGVSAGADSCGETPR